MDSKPYFAGHIFTRIIKLKRKSEEKMLPAIDIANLPS